jgi:hypothetical protein
MVFDAIEKRFRSVVVPLCELPVDGIFKLGEVEELGACNISGRGGGDERGWGGGSAMHYVWLFTSTSTRYKLRL